VSFDIAPAQEISLRHFIVMGALGYKNHLEAVGGAGSANADAVLDFQRGLHNGQI
jgi:hypothetical protein